MLCYKTSAKGKEVDVQREEGSQEPEEKNEFENEEFEVIRSIYMYSN